MFILIFNGLRAPKLQVQIFSQLQKSLRSKLNVCKIKKLKLFV